MDASFEEKSVWVQLVAMVAVLGAYFVVAGRMMARGVLVMAPYVPLFAVAVVLMVVVMGVGYALAAVSGRQERPDERDRLIGWKSEARSSWIVGVGVICGISAMIVGVESVWVVHLLLGSMFVSEVVKYALAILYYRRGV